MHAFSCHDDGSADAVCQPRVRTRLLVVGAAGETRALVDAAAQLLRVGSVHHETLDEALGFLDGGARVSCVVLDSALDPLGALARLKAARSDVPAVVVGADSTLALAAVQAG